MTDTSNTYRSDITQHVFWLGWAGAKIAEAFWGDHQYMVETAWQDALHNMGMLKD